MKNTRFSKSAKFFPLLGLIVIFAVQFFHSQATLQAYKFRTERNRETLQERMNEDNVPQNIKEHIAYVYDQTTFSTDLVVDSLSFMQIFTQVNIWIVFFSFFLMRNKPSGDE